ncbi:MAG: hypothetical protein OXE79_11185 [Acidimicrobiaceae bacterium]|nr:hypothetical protein [Acidimicrobiaceae bacterium]MCY4175361.1 hypothetical protein [Acidimicrobiaceae bacterium]MCY4294224.1 hypothetical protein [Acidimicrobiaceae bacterium]
MTPAFARGHAEQQRKPVAHGAELLSFDVVLAAAACDIKPPVFVSFAVRNTTLTQEAHPLHAATNLYDH